jgi:hypothetical protein
MRSRPPILRPIQILLSIGSWVFAQGGDISGSVKERSNGLGVGWAIVTVRDVASGTIAGMGTTDDLGNYSISVPSSGKYRLLASKLGYETSTAPEVIAMSDVNSKEIINLSMSREAWLESNPAKTRPALSWETGKGKSYLIPALEIPAFLFLLNSYDRRVYPNLMEDGKKVYSPTFTTTLDHTLHGPWVIDQDAFAMNQFNHPYGGTVYHSLARSAGLTYWESLVYDNAGSLLWELGGETSKPSINDQIATGVGGSFFGEALFRMSSLVLEGDGTSPPGFWRTLGATMLSPATGINRLMFGDRFKPVFPSYHPPHFWRVRLGENLHSDLNDQGVTSTDHRNEVTADYSIVYGHPGQPGYSYERPFDYFDFELTTLGNRANPVDNIMVRGSLLAKDYEVGDTYQGIWGLYGGYDYISPHIFRVSSTSVSFGTTFQWWLTPKLAFQGSALGGVGYAAAGNVTQVGDRDYHYGVAPQVLLAFRFIFSDRVMLDMTGRRYSLTGMGGNDPGGREAIDRLNIGLTVRIYRTHALGIQYISSTRDASYPNRANSHQEVGTVALVYNLLGNTGFGVVR